MSHIPPIRNGGDILLLIVGILIVVPLLGGVFLLQAWIGVQVVTLILAGEFWAAYGWACVFGIIASLAGALAGTGRR